MKNSLYKVLEGPKGDNTVEEATAVLSSVYPGYTVRVIEAGDNFKAYLSLRTAAPEDELDDVIDDGDNEDTKPTPPKEKNKKEDDDPDKDTKDDKEKGDGDPLEKAKSLFKELADLMPQLEKIVDVSPVEEPDEGDIPPVPAHPPVPPIPGGKPPAAVGPHMGPVPPAPGPVPPGRGGPLPAFSKRTKVISTEPDNGDLTIADAIAALEEDPQWKDYRVDEIKRDTHRMCYHAKLILKEE